MTSTIIATIMPYSIAEAPRWLLITFETMQCSRMFIHNSRQYPLGSHWSIKLPLKTELRLENLPTPLPPMLVVAVALIDKQGRVLMQQRDFAAAHGGLWEFPGGKVDPGESPEDAAVRELAEELGIVLTVDALEPVTFASGLTVAAEQGGKGPVRPLVILLYACRIWNGTPKALEAADLAWTAPQKIADLSMPPLDYPLARGLGRHLFGSVADN